MLRVAMYQPDIPQNLGAMIRMCACTGTGLDVIEPTGFPWDERKIRKAAMDYMDHIEMQKHESWPAFQQKRAESKQASQRLVLITTKSEIAYTDFEFEKDDIILAGREGGGVPEDIHKSADARLVIPMHPGLRSLNVVNAAAMVLGEALRQTGWSH